MKYVYISCDERYPVYSVKETDVLYGELYEICEVKLKRWQKVIKDYEDVQQEIEQLITPKASY